MPLIFNSVTQFVETIGQQREHQSNPAQLDTMESIFTGPAELATGFVPLDLAVHPEFSGMRCSGWRVVKKEALMAEVRANYTGTLTAGSGPYTTPPLITPSRHLGEVSYTTSASLSLTQIRTSSYTIRFTARGVTFRYLTNRALPAGFNGSFAAQADPYLGTENLQQFQTGLSFATGAPTYDASLGYGGYVTSQLVWKNDLTDVTANPLGNGWWDVSEVYLTQPHINSSVH